MDTLIQLCHQCRQQSSACQATQSQVANCLTELSQYPPAIRNLNNRNRAADAQNLLAYAAPLQQDTTGLIDQLVTHRDKLLHVYVQCLQLIPQLMQQLFAIPLLEWRHRQKLMQIGCDFPEFAAQLDAIEKNVEQLIECILELRTAAQRQLELVQRGPRSSNPKQQAHADAFQHALHLLTGCFHELTSKSLVVYKQPEPVLKSQNKFDVELRLLAGEKFGIKQALANASVHVRIVSEEDARKFSMGQLDIFSQKPIGQITNNTSKFVTNDHGRLVVRFDHSKLNKITHRRQGTTRQPANAAEQRLTAAAIDQQYALVFDVDTFHIGDMGPICLQAIALPVAVIVHVSQDAYAQALMFWQRSFSNVDRSLPAGEMTAAVPWERVGDALRYKFSHFISAKTRRLSDDDLRYLSHKVIDEHAKVTFHRFAREFMATVDFSFWTWLYNIMTLIKHKLLEFWEHRWLLGFISKEQTNQTLLNSSEPSFLLRFSDSQLGAVSIGFTKNNGTRQVLHLNPLTTADLNRLPMSQRIESCPDLAHIRYFYPNLAKDSMIQHFAAAEPQQIEPLKQTQGYVRPRLVMVVDAVDFGICHSQNVAQRISVLAICPYLSGSDPDLSNSSNIFDRMDGLLDFGQSYSTQIDEHGDIPPSSDDLYDLDSTLL